jgi:L-aspartate oxidase
MMLMKDTIHYDTIIIGSGISGLNLARKLSEAGQRVFLSAKEAVTEGSSKYAQGGVAVVNPLEDQEDLFLHIKDTLDSGKGICNEDAVNQVIESGWSKVQELVGLGVKFDEDFHLEGSHSKHRVLHNSDSTGKAILIPLLDCVSRDYNISIQQGTEAISLIKSSMRIVGVRFSDITGEEFDVFANNVVLASGGLAGIYQDFTCPDILRGDGIALAYDAGAKIENLEFVQFHPTVFKTKDAKNFLISEALRGAGALLRNSNQEFFANKYHPSAELATRDVVSRAIFNEMRLCDSDFVYLDARALGKDLLMKQFPTIYQNCLDNGYDLAIDLLPVRPAAHYSIGGVKTDLRGRTNIDGLYAIGEVASTGLHGANRLASNSLLECIVMADYLAQDIIDNNFEIYIEDYEYCSDYFVPFEHEEKLSHQENLENIRNVMSKNLSVERRQKAIQSTLKYLESLEPCKELTVATLLAKSALSRKESRGVHYRVDAPNTDKSYERATIISKDSALRKVILTDKIKLSLKG